MSNPEPRISRARATDRAASVETAARAFEADRAGLDAYLVTATPENVAFYARHGFEVHVETDFPAASGSRGPHIWMLVRPHHG